MRSPTKLLSSSKYKSTPRMSSLIGTPISGLTKIRLKVNHMFEIARRRRSAREPVNSAFFADQPVTLSIAKMYEGLMERAMITVGVFEKREAGAEWPGVPLQILYPPSKKGSKPAT